MSTTIDASPEYNQAAPESPFAGVRCSRWYAFQPNNRPSLLGYADFFVPGLGLEIRDCTVHTFPNHLRIEFPQRVHRNSKTGEMEHRNVIVLRGKHFEAFHRAALAAWQQVADAK